MLKLMVKKIFIVYAKNVFIWTKPKLLNFFISPRNHKCCGLSFELSQRDDSDEYFP